ncbi:Neurobeachin-like protein 1 [Phlyctochytrium bullatum]|nr:Neurobeachin-like protein 1 [Phlyctochytrium bullatum]
MGVNIVKDLIFLVQLPSNAEAVRKIYGWQALLFECLHPSVFENDTYEDSPANTESGNPSDPQQAEGLPPSSREYAFAFNESILKLLAFLTYEAFEYEKKAWRAVEESMAIVWLLRRFSDRENGVKIIRRYFYHLLYLIRKEVGTKHASVISSIKTENIWHLLLLTEELMFNHHDLKDSLLGDLKAMSKSIPQELLKVVDQDSHSLFYEVGKKKLPLRIQSLSRRDSDDIIIRISYPFEECRDLVEETLAILNSFIESGITSIPLSEPDKDLEGFNILTETVISESLTSESRFIDLVKTRSWEAIFDNHLFPALKAVEQEEFSIVPLAIKRFVKVVRATYVRWRKEEYAAMKTFDVTFAHVKGVASRKAVEEAARVSEKTEERAIWAPMKFDISSQRWKLDRTENHLRMRLRLTQNYEFDDHRDAAARRDKVHLSTFDLNQISLQSSARIERAMISQTAAAALASAAADRRKAQVEKLRMQFEAGSTSDLMKEVSESSLGSRVTEEDLEDEWDVVGDSDPPQLTSSASMSSIVKGAGAAGDEVERLICGADCELILLMTAVKGRLELYGSYVSFRADLRKTAAELNEADQRILALLAEAEVLTKERRWPLANLREVYMRRYMILVDYTSETLDLTDPGVYRDLSKPIGALNDARLEQYLERFRQFEDPSGTVKKFLYGTHYSTSAAVLFYLIRLEPFASLHIALQAGKFDHPDRLLEFCLYRHPVLTGKNKFDLGQKQTGAIVDDVILPNWASSPEEFVRVHREALEGDYVSDHLHEWIDLIWGYKQTGEEAVKANNVFYYLTYEGAINIDSVKDPIERKSIEDQINNFGQTPSQLFLKPHPQRLRRDQFQKPTIFGNPQNHKSFLINLKGLADGLIIRQDNRRIFYGHDEEVTTVAANVEHDLLVTGSKVPV